MRMKLTTDVEKKQAMQIQEMGVSKNSGTPKWMVYNGKPS